MLSQEALIVQELHQAAEGGNIARVKELLPALGEEYPQWLRGAFMRSVYENEVRTVYVLLEANASIDSVDDLGLTSLHWTARMGFLGLAQVLLKRKASVASRNPDGLTPLHLAVENNHGPLVQLLIRSDADTSALTLDKRTPLHVGAEVGSSVAVAVILEAKPDGGNLLEVETSRGETPLVRAAARGNAAIVQLLLRVGADTEHRNLWGQSPLSLSSLGGHVGSCAGLIEAHADVNSVANDKSTPLHSAVDRGHAQVVELLLTSNASAIARAKGNRTPLHTAAERGCLEAADALIAYRADVNSRAEEGRTPLACAATRGHVAVAQRLLEEGADPHVTDALKQTPLHAAAAAGRAGVADLIILRRVKIEAEDAAGRTPMQLALAFKQESTVRILLKRGATLPEEVASLPEMQPLINEVENELLQESLNEVEAGKLREQMTAAKNKFEDARLEMLSICSRSITAKTAPVIRHSEQLFATAKEQVRVKQNMERDLVNQIKMNEKAVLEAEKEVRMQRGNLHGLTNAVEELKNGRGAKFEEAMRLLRETAEAKKQDGHYQGEEAKLAERRDQTALTVEGLREKLLGITTENRGLFEKLEEVQAQLEKWNAEKAEAATLHKQAQAILNSNLPSVLSHLHRPDSRSRG